MTTTNGTAVDIKSFLRDPNLSGDCKLILHDSKCHVKNGGTGNTSTKRNGCVLLISVEKNAFTDSLIGISYSFKKSTGPVYSCLIVYIKKHESV